MREIFTYGSVKGRRVANALTWKRTDEHACFFEVMTYCLPRPKLVGNVTTSW